MAGGLLTFEAGRRLATTVVQLLVGVVVTCGCHEYTCLGTVGCEQIASSSGLSSDAVDATSVPGLEQSIPPLSPNPITTGLPNGTAVIPPTSVPLPTTVTTPPRVPPQASNSNDDVKSDSGLGVESSATPSTEPPASFTFWTETGSAQTLDQSITEAENTALSSVALSDDSTQERSDSSRSDEVPDTSHCAAVADWDPAWSQWEQEVLHLVNEVRANGADCDSEGSFGPTAPLSMDPILRCSSRLHSEDMYVRDYFDHTNPDGLDPFERMDEAGFVGGWMGENIAYGQQSPDEVMQAWVDSDGHCSNIMNPHFTLIGVGYFPGGATWQEGQHFWTQNFGAPLN